MVEHRSLTPGAAQSQRRSAHAARGVAAGAGRGLKSGRVLRTPQARAVRVKPLVEGLAIAPGDKPGAGQRVRARGLRRLEFSEADPAGETELISGDNLLDSQAQRGAGNAAVGFRVLIVFHEPDHPNFPAPPSLHRANGLRGDWFTPKELRPLTLMRAIGSPRFSA